MPPRKRTTRGKKAVPLQDEELERVTAIYKDMKEQFDTITNSLEQERDVIVKRVVSAFEVEFPKVPKNVRDQNWLLFVRTGLAETDENAENANPRKKIIKAEETDPTKTAEVEQSSSSIVIKQEPIDDPIDPNNTSFAIPRIPKKATSKAPPKKLRSSKAMTETPHISKGKVKKIPLITPKVDPISARGMENREIREGEITFSMEGSPVVRPAELTNASASSFIVADGKRINLDDAGELKGDDIDSVLQLKRKLSMMVKSSSKK